MNPNEDTFIPIEFKIVLELLRYGPCKVKRLDYTMTSPLSIIYSDDLYSGPSQYEATHKYNDIISRLMLSKYWKVKGIQEAGITRFMLFTPDPVYPWQDFWSKFLHD